MLKPILHVLSNMAFCIKIYRTGQGLSSFNFHVICLEEYLLWIVLLILSMQVSVAMFLYSLLSSLYILHHSGDGIVKVVTIMNSYIY
jgi:hypothetical protein